MPHSDWSRPLPEPLDIGKRKKLRTLHDLSQFLLSLSPERQAKRGWQNVTKLAMEAADGTGDASRIPVAFKIARMHDP